MVPEEIEPFLFKTTDGGKTYATPDYGQTWSVKKDFDQYMEDISFLNDSSYIYSDKNDIYITANNGKDWKEYPFFYMNRIFYTSSNDIYILQNDLKNIHYSDDGGISFIEMTGMSDDFELNDITFVNNKLGYAVGSDGVILKYQNE